MEVYEDFPFEFSKKRIKPFYILKSAIEFILNGDRSYD
jgi:hypothetical protein